MRGRPSLNPGQTEVSERVKSRVDHSSSSPLVPGPAHAHSTFSGCAPSARLASDGSVCAERLQARGRVQRCVLVPAVAVDAGPAAEVAFP